MFRLAYLFFSFSLEKAAGNNATNASEILITPESSQSLSTASSFSCDVSTDVISSQYQPLTQTTVASISPTPNTTTALDSSSGINLVSDENNHANSIAETIMTPPPYTQNNNSTSEMLYQDMHGNLYTADGQRIYIEAENVTENETYGDFSSDDAMPQNVTLEDLFRVQSTAALKVIKMEVDMKKLKSDVEDVLKYVKSVDDKLDLLLNARHIQYPTNVTRSITPIVNREVNIADRERVYLRKVLETVEEFKEVEQNLQRTMFQEEMVCFITSHICAMCLGCAMTTFFRSMHYF